MHTTPFSAGTLPSSHRKEKRPCTCYGKQNPEHKLPETLSCDATYQGKVLETPGFLWVPNHILTKKWRTSATGDERLHDLLLADFTKFCSNEDERLSDIVKDVCEEDGANSS